VKSNEHGGELEPRACDRAQLKGIDFAGPSMGTAGLEPATSRV
jgi:hypothetical protein